MEALNLEALTRADSGYIRQECSERLGVYEVHRFLLTDGSSSERVQSAALSILSFLEANPHLVFVSRPCFPSVPLNY